MNHDLDIALFEPERVLPPQLSWGARCDGTTSGVRALMIAILEDATLCIERGRQRRHWRTRLLAAEAETWVRSDCRGWLFSFASICDVLGLDPDALRARLLSHAARSASAARPETDAPSIRSGAVLHMVPQREGAPASIAAVGSTRRLVRHPAGSRGAGGGFGVRAPAGVA